MNMHILSNIIESLKIICLASLKRGI